MLRLVARFASRARPAAARWATTCLPRLAARRAGAVLARTAVRPLPSARWSGVSGQSSVRWWSSASAASGGGATPVPVPPLGDSISEGQIIEVLVEEGQAVAEDDIIFVIETDKVSVDIRAPMSGVITELLIGEGEDVEVGQQVCTIDPSGEAASAPKKKGKKEAKKEEKKEAKKAPKEAKKEEPKAAESAPATHHRQPMIRFRYGKGREQQQAQQSAAGGEELVAPASLPFVEIPERYRRPPMSEHEMHVVELGGAEPY